MTATDTNSIRRALRSGADRSAAAAATRLAELAGDAGVLDVAYTTADTPLGPTLVAATKRGLVNVSLPNHPAEEALERLAGEVSPRMLESRSDLDEVLRELDEYFAGRRDAFDLKLDWGLVKAPFMRGVLRETARVPFGATRTYGEVAAKAGHPGAHRAAGTALGHNPIPIVVPCHRVIRSGGVLGNYGGGPEMKEYLLRLEGAISGK
jgi:methylated-DNA-[protein]-cysteine S-methyltransferase